MVLLFLDAETEISFCPSLPFVKSSGIRSVAWSVKTDELRDRSHYQELIKVQMILAVRELGYTDFCKS